MIQIVALLYASENGMKGLRDFESKAIPILREHGGKLISASFNENEDKALNEPDEIHVIQFPSIDAFNAYKIDPRIVALSSLKSKMIEKTDVYITTNFHQY